MEGEARWYIMVPKLLKPAPKFRKYGYLTLSAWHRENIFTNFVDVYSAI